MDYTAVTVINVATSNWNAERGFSSKEIILQIYIHELLR